MALLWKKSSSVPLQRLRLISLPPITHSFQSKGSSRISGWRTDDEIKTLFDEWTITHERTYTGVEREEKFQIWRNKLREIERHNNTGCPSWKKGLNQFSDMTYEEFARVMLLTPVDHMSMGYGYPRRNYSLNDPNPSHHHRV